VTPCTTAVGEATTSMPNSFTSVSDGTAWIPSAVYIVNGMTIESLVPLHEGGLRSTAFKAKAGGKALAVILIDSGPAHRSNLLNVRISANGVTGQHRIYALARGEWWCPSVEGVRVDDLDGDGIWLHDGAPTNQTPHQFLTFKDV